MGRESVSGSFGTRIAMMKEPRENDPRVAHVLDAMENAERQFEEHRRQGKKVSRSEHDENAPLRLFWAGYFMGLRYAVGALPVYRTHYNPPEGYIDA